MLTLRTKVILTALTCTALVAVTIHLYLEVTAAPPASTAVSPRGGQAALRTAPPSATPALVGRGDSPALPTVAVPDTQLSVATPTPGKKYAYAGEPDDPAVFDVLALPEDDPRMRSTVAFDEVNKAYDRGDFDEARQMALKLLRKNPGLPRLARVVISASCILNDVGPDIHKLYGLLPAADRETMRVRCARYDVQLPSSL